MKECKYGCTYLHLCYCIKQVQCMVVCQGVQEPLLWALHHHFQVPVTNWMIEMWNVLKEPFLSFTSKVGSDIVYLHLNAGSTQQTVHLDPSQDASYKGLKFFKIWPSWVCLRMHQFYSCLYQDRFFWIYLSSIGESSLDHLSDPIIWLLQAINWSEMPWPLVSATNLSWWLSISTVSLHTNTYGGIGTLWVSPIRFASLKWILSLCVSHAMHTTSMGLVSCSTDFLPCHICRISIAISCCLWIMHVCIWPALASIVGTSY